MLNSSIPLECENGFLCSFAPGSWLVSGVGFAVQRLDVQGSTCEPDGSTVQRSMRLTLVVEIILAKQLLQSHKLPMKHEACDHVAPGFNPGF